VLSVDGDKCSVYIRKLSRNIDVLLDMVDSGSSYKGPMRVNSILDVKLNIRSQPYSFIHVYTSVEYIGFIDSVVINGSQVKAFVSCVAMPYGIKRAFINDVFIQMPWLNKNQLNNSLIGCQVVFRVTPGKFIYSFIIVI
jgi:hypothetical protein